MTPNFPRWTSCLRSNSLPFRIKALPVSHLPRFQPVSNPSPNPFPLDVERVPAGSSPLSWQSRLHSAVPHIRIKALHANVLSRFRSNSVHSKLAVISAPKFTTASLKRQTVRPTQVSRVRLIVGGKIFRLVPFDFLQREENAAVVSVRPKQALSQTIEFLEVLFPFVQLGPGTGALARQALNHCDFAFGRAGDGQE
jgi:hypothetical protein